MRKFVRALVRSRGYDIVGFDPRFNMRARKLEILRKLPCSCFLDIGANVGQFGLWLRANGFGGAIHSFEPGAQAFKGLQKNSASDAKWHVHKLALGASEGNEVLNVSEDSFSSSLRAPTDRNIAAHKGVITGYTEKVRVATVDEWVAHNIREIGSVAVKIDTQGYEAEVLEGARKTLPEICLLIVEVSLREVYQGQKLSDEIFRILYENGFYATILESCDEDRAVREILQLDAWFLNGRKWGSAFG